MIEKTYNYDAARQIECVGSKVLVLADLHLDHYLGQGMDPFKNVPSEQLLDVTHCILAGDLSNKGHKKWKQCLPWIAERLPNAQVFVMSGNHDYYDGNIDQEDKLRAVANDHGAEFLQKSELLFGRHRLLCATLWSDFQVYGDRVDNMRHASSGMNDYKSIRVAKTGFKRVTPSQTATIFHGHLTWLDEKLSEHFNGETTVVTHHAPHRMALLRETALGPCYASDLEGLILKYQPKRWLYGHTHHTVSFTVGATLLQNVSVGYPGEFPSLDSLHQHIFDLA